jgi:hypothetical protein
MDPERFARDTMMVALLDAKLEELDRFTHDLAASTHQGPGPCLRYPERGSVPEEELAALAEAIVAGGFADDLAHLLGQFRQWEAEAEQGMHQSSQAEETLDALRERMNLFARLIYALARDRVKGAAMNLVATQEAELMKKAGEAMAAYPSERRAQLKALWEKSPRCLTLPSMVRLLDQVKMVATRARLDRLAARLEDFARREGAFPDDLRSLGPAQAGQQADPDLKDGWYQDFEYKRIEGGVRLTSLGDDSAPGGEGRGADLEREVLYPGENLGTSELATQAVRCAAPATKVEITRAEAEVLLKAEQDRPTGNLVAPAYEEGVVIGFTVNAVRPGTLAHRLGLRDHDIVLALLGERLDNPDKALQLYQRLGTAARVEVEIQRCQTPYLIEVTVR